MNNERGSALLLALLVLSIFSLLGLIMSLEAVTGLRISDNYESRVRAECASIAGLNHAHVLMRGLRNDSFLTGPDGTYNPDPSYLNLVKGYEFRNPLSISVAQMLDIADPGKDLMGYPDDGLINTGYYSVSEGLLLIPLEGIAQKYSETGNTENVTGSRYFVKVTDNNGEAPERQRDPADSPFFDGDGEVIIRSMGIARTFTDVAGSVHRKNSVVVYEGRYRRFAAFNFGSALIAAGSGIVPSFEGAYAIDGGPFPGIGVIDADEEDMVGIIDSGPLGNGVISGAGLPNPSVLDVTRETADDPDRSRIMDAEYLRDFAIRMAPEFSDNYHAGDQFWASGNAPDIGSYDLTKPFNAPGQSPKVTVVHGNLQMAGFISGAGLLVVTGEFQCLDFCRYTGLVLAIGRGDATIDADGTGITGGLFIAGLVYVNGQAEFGNPVFSIRGNSRITADSNAVEMALSLIPPMRTSFREIAGVDP